MAPDPETTSSNLIHQSNRIGIEFLLADLATGLTFTEVAAVTSSVEGRARNWDKAREVYRTVMRLLQRVSPSPEEQSQLQSRLEELKRRLEKAGYSPEI